MPESTKPIRVVLVDDHVILQQGIASLLREYEDVEVVGEASSGPEALLLVETLLPDVLISDVAMPHLSGYDLLEQVKARQVPTRVLFLTMYDKPDFITKALQMGVAGYLTKDTVKDELVQAVRAISSGQVYFGRRITQAIANEFVAIKSAPRQGENLRTKLSKREYEIIVLISEGLSTRQIADKLFISERTVSNHRVNIMNKCNVNNSVELAKLYLQSQQE
jgi:DNA-binding NarL/FixJ family response regulator